MTGIEQLLSQTRAFRKRSPATLEQINRAETILNLRFSEEYKEYLLAFGAASIFGHEFTGICPSPRLDVVSVTNAERLNHSNIPSNWYVIEQANIDGIVIWQSKTGEIYQSAPHTAPTKLCNSLAEYIQL